MNQQAAHFFSSLTDPGINGVLAQWQDEKPDSSILAFVAEADRHDIPALQDRCNEAGRTVLGAVFPELLYGNRFRKNGLLLFRFDSKPSYKIVTGLASGMVEESPAIRNMLSVAEDLKDKPGKGTLLMIFDAMVPNIESWLEALYGHIGHDVHYLGVNAGSETFQPVPCLFDNQVITQDAVLIAALPEMPGGVLEHGYRPPDKMITATSTHGNRIITIDWRPALEAYSEIAEHEYGVKITRDNFYEYGVHFPFGIIRATGEVVVRIPVAIDEDNALFCIGEVPENTILALLRADDADPSRTVANLARHLTDTKADCILTFYCAGRRMHDPAAATEELATLSKKLPVPLAGALSLGEIGSSIRDGYPLFHNATLVCADWNTA